jgi:phage shock protein A
MWSPRKSACSFRRSTFAAGGQDVDRQLDELGAKSAVDDEFVKLKAEVESSAQQSALPAGEPAAGGTPQAAPKEPDP